MKHFLTYSKYFKYVKHVKLLMLTTITTLLIGCVTGNTKKDFACKPVMVNGELVCPTITEADNVVNHKQNTKKQKEPILIHSAKDLREDLNKNKNQNKSSNASTNTSASTNNTTQSLTEANQEKSLSPRIIPTRTTEKIGKIWFAPFLDESGNFFDESYTYVILEPAKWQIKKTN